VNLSHSEPSIQILGHRGRFGSRIFSILRESGIAAFPLDAAGTPHAPTALIDASSPAAIDTLAAAALSTRSGVVYCVSGTSAQQHERLRALAEQVPVITVQNATVGSHLQLALARALAESPLLEDYQRAYTVLDRHPTTKKDAPSATAIRLADVLRSAAQAVAVRSDRYGDPVADHSIVLEFGSETLRVEHSVSSLDNSARQVAKLGLLIPCLPVGFYSVSDIYEHFGAVLPALPRVAEG
jgi:4-hydroxy-tetrahydrodipicolinate reductase